MRRREIEAVALRYIRQAAKRGADEDFKSALIEALHSADREYRSRIIFYRTAPGDHQEGRKRCWQRYVDTVEAVAMVARGYRRQQPEAVWLM